MRWIVAEKSLCTWGVDRTEDNDLVKWKSSILLQKIRYGMQVWSG